MSSVSWRSFPFAHYTNVAEAEAQTVKASCRKRPSAHRWKVTNGSGARTRLNFKHDLSSCELDDLFIHSLTLKAIGQENPIKGTEHSKYEILHQLSTSWNRFKSILEIMIRSISRWNHIDDIDERNAVFVVSFSVGFCGCFLYTGCFELQHKKTTGSLRRNLV